MDRLKFNQKYIFQWHYLNANIYTHKFVGKKETFTDLFSGKGPSATRCLPISKYIEDFGEEKMCETVKSSLSLMDPHLFRSWFYNIREMPIRKKIDMAINVVMDAGFPF